MMHESITEDRALAAAQESEFGLSNTGFCLACGEEQEGCEPDARKYRCENCGEHKVYGASEIVIMLCA